MKTVRRLCFGLVLLSIAAAVLTTSAAFACENCCCCAGEEDAVVPVPVEFATSCYTGNGNDNRIIITGIPQAKAGLLEVCEKTVSGGNNNVCRWKIPEMTQFSGEESCLWAGSSNGCATNYIQSFNEESFTIGNGATQPVNATGRPFCYQQWSLSPQHGTFSYVGDGTADRHINTLTTTNAVIAPDWVGLMDANNSLAGTDGVYTRTNDFAANTSCRAINAVSCVTDMILALDSTGFTVGAARGNISGHIYYGFWFKTRNNYIHTTNYTGTSGTSAGSCTTGGDATRDMTITGCDRIYGWMGQKSTQTPTCTTSRDTDGMWWRTSAVGINVVGPGNNATDTYAFNVTQPVPGNVGITDFDDADNTITLVANHMNQLGQGNVALITCAGLAQPGAVSAASWASPAPDTIVYYNVDEATGTERPNNECGVAAPASGGTVGCPAPGCLCDLVDFGSVVQDTVNKVIGTASASFDAASSQFLAITAPNLNTFGTSGGSVSWGGYIWATDDEDITYMSKSGPTQTNIMRLSRAGATDTFVCQHKNSAGTAATRSVSGFTTGAWHFVACKFDNTLNQINVYSNGTPSSAVAANNDMANGTGTFGIAGYDSATGGSIGTGKIDGAFVYNNTISDTDMCRICSCGFDGSLCSCFSVDTTLYVDSGRNVSHCGSCTLPACDKPAPA